MGTERYTNISFDIIRQAIENVDISMAILSDNLNILWINRGMEELTGVSKEDALGLTTPELFTKKLRKVFENGEEFEKRLFSAYENNTPIEGMECHIMAQGRRKERWLLFWSKPVRAEGCGRVEYFLDITCYRSYINDVAESEEVFRTIAISALDAIVMVDGKGSITFWNRAAERMFGYTQSEAMGRKLYKLIIPEGQHQQFMEGFKRFAATGEGSFIGKTLETRGVRKDRTEVPVELSLAGVKRKGAWYGIGIMRDITKRIEIEEELKHKIDDLERMNRIMVGRELRMEELRREIVRLRKRIDELESNK